MSEYHHGLAFANEKVIKLFDKVKPPYNVSQIAQKLILVALENQPRVNDTIAEIVRERKALADHLVKFSFIQRVYPSDANFLLVKTARANDVYSFLIDKKIVVRNRSNVVLCEGCLRVTVGTANENRALISALEKYEESLVY